MDLDEKSYTLVNENVRCLGTTPIFKGFKSNDECRESCDGKDSCKFYAIWISPTGQRTWCETYSERPSESPDGTHSIHMWKKNESGNLEKITIGPAYDNLEDRDRDCQQSIC